MEQEQSKPNSSNEENAEQDQISFGTTVLSVIQASFGVQSQKNRERDFKHGKLLPFIVAGVGFTFVFVLTLFFIVKWVLATTT